MPETPWSCQLALWRWTSDCWDVPRVYGRHLIRFRCWQRGQAREALLKSAKNGTLAAAVSAVHSAHKDRVHSMSHSLRRRGMWRAFSKSDAALLHTASQELAKCVKLVGTLPEIRWQHTASLKYQQRMVRMSVFHPSSWRHLKIPNLFLLVSMSS